MKRRLLQLHALLQCELRLRSRRGATLVVLLAVLALSWFSLADPRTGRALMVAEGQRLLYSSDTLAFGSAILGAVLLSLTGFYLARGRTQEDLRTGMAGVLAAAPVSNRLLLLARWLGALGYLLGLGLALMLSTWALHGLRGEGPLQIGVYLQSYALILLPALAGTAAFAVLADAWAPLNGRRGDVAYFFVWTLLMGLMPLHESRGPGFSPLAFFDLSGLAASIGQLTPLLGSKTAVSIGGSPFKPELGLLAFPGGFWNGSLVAQRAAAATVALPLLLLAGLGFHRYAPDRVRARARPPGRLRRAGQALLRPASRGVGALLPMAARLPQPLAGGAAELLLSLMTQPWALLALVVAWGATATAPAAALGPTQAALALVWGLLAAELGARDAQRGTADVGSTLVGGAWGRLLQRWMAALGLGMLLNAGALLRQPQASLGWLIGLGFLAALATLLGRLTHGSRCFLALFLFWLLMAVQVRDVAWLDVLGFNGQGGGLQMLAAAAATVLALATAAAAAQRRS